MKKKTIQDEPPKTNKRRLAKYYRKAKTVICNEKKMEHFLARLEMKLKQIPKCGGKLAYAPVFAALLNHYFHKSYFFTLSIFLVV